MKLIVLIVFLFHSFFVLSQQKQVITEEKTFLGYFNQMRFTKRIGTWIDLHHRTTDNFVNRPFQSLGRLGLTFFITDHFRFTAGYCFAYNYPVKGTHANRIEHRPWQQLLLKQEYHNVQTIQFLRLEERYNQEVINDEATNNYIYTNRLRYNYMVLIPFSKNGISLKKLFGVLNDEVFVNFGKNITYNTFDQNRFFCGIGYQIGKNSSVHLGYMNIYQQLSAGYKYSESHCIRLFVYHNIDFRKEKS
ncbi:MAG: DUF2490 domain-containing protein [Bacteroidetes bacterium]|nr:DUF2490 domain-containing protein [Bacteroidota bacterium]